MNIGIEIFQQDAPKPTSSGSNASSPEAGIPVFTIRLKEIYAS